MKPIERACELIEVLTKLNEKLEAELEEAKKHSNNLGDLLAKVEADNENLKCCGNCGIDNMKMTGQIKFRAYQDNQMLISPIHSNYGLQRFFGLLYEDAKIMQFTGLKDKNSKEIYEGDIVRILYTDWASKSQSDERTLEQYLIDIASIGVIEFNEDRFSVKTKSKKYNDFDYSSIFAGRHGYIEVIGNIYQDARLL